MSNPALVPGTASRTAPVNGRYDTNVVPRRRRIAVTDRAGCGALVLPARGRATSSRTHRDRRGAPDREPIVRKLLNREERERWFARFTMLENDLDWPIGHSVVPK